MKPIGNNYSGSGGLYSGGGHNRYSNHAKVDHDRYTGHAKVEL